LALSGWGYAAVCRKCYNEYYNQAQTSEREGSLCDPNKP
jgi:hypothetical protein